MSFNKTTNFLIDVPLIVFLYDGRKIMLPMSWCMPSECDLIKGSFGTFFRLNFQDLLISFGHRSLDPSRSDTKYVYFSFILDSESSAEIVIEYLGGSIHRYTCKRRDHTDTGEVYDSTARRLEFLGR